MTLSLVSNNLNKRPQMSSNLMTLVSLQPDKIDTKIKSWQRKMAFDKSSKKATTISLYKVEDSATLYVKVFGHLDHLTQKHLHLVPVRENIPPFELKLVHTAQ